MKQALLFIMLLLISMSCEDDIPNDYQPEVFVEGYLLVGNPIENIIVQRSQSVADSFEYKKSLISNAQVTVRDMSNDRLYRLDFRDDEKQGYYYTGNYLVLPETKYRLEVEIDGKLITGETTTPPVFNWIEDFRDYIQYPTDTINLPSPDSLRFSWEKVPNHIWYLVRVTCLDTLEYGKYLTPPSDEMNRRIWRPFGRGTRYYDEVVNWAGPTPTNKSNIVWFSVKWFGKQEIAILAPDYNLLRWFIQIQRSTEYSPLLGSLEGGMGMFGSASLIRDTTFILKNQP